MIRYPDTQPDTLKLAMHRAYGQLDLLDMSVMEFID